ncbi:MAG: 2Fe-2S iron-sulfur cluster binding domain-containing protein [Chloroflexi bacterium]|nr:MAG: 2Fe-2S iron-sulfur cluster binding domain-containing protein [Chloroflexota bacterium]TMD68470.1 MAG: 2Fe-2S iron-sulfur cluster binding domain-containing protein [Chloroflexota bacterium]
MPRSFRVQFVKSGKTIDVAENEGILGAGLQAGISLAFDCRKGRCKTCMVRVDGIIDQSDAWLISNEELAEGFALICVGKPRSDLRVHA